MVIFSFDVFSPVIFSEPFTHFLLKYNYHFYSVYICTRVLRVKNNTWILPSWPTIIFIFSHVDIFLDKIRKNSLIHELFSYWRTRMIQFWKFDINSDDNVFIDKWLVSIAKLNVNVRWQFFTSVNYKCTRSIENKSTVVYRNYKKKMKQHSQVWNQGIVKADWFENIAFAIIHRNSVQTQITHKIYKYVMKGNRA